MRIEIELSHEEVKTAISEYLASRGHPLQITEVHDNREKQQLILQIVGEPIPQPPKPKVVLRTATNTSY